MVRMSRIWKLYLIYTILLVAGITLAGLVLERRLKEKLNQHLREDVLTLARVLGNALPDTGQHGVLERFCKTYSRIAGLRITIIGSDGRVLADSEKEAALGDSRLNRPEVAAALESDSGFATRFSKTLNMEMLYGAVFVRDKGKLVRLAMPISRVQVFQSEVMLLMSLALFMAPVMAIIVSFFVTKHKIYQDEGHGMGARPRHL